MVLIRILFQHSVKRRSISGAGIRELDFSDFKAIYVCFRIGKLYRAYKDMEEVGLNFSEFDYNQGPMLQNFKCPQLINVQSKLSVCPCKGSSA
jgi:hypothetical protein